MELVFVIFVIVVEWFIIDCCSFLYCKLFTRRRVKSGKSFYCINDVCLKRLQCEYWYKNQRKSQSKTNAEPETHSQDASAD